MLRGRSLEMKDAHLVTNTMCNLLFIPQHTTTLGDGVCINNALVNNPSESTIARVQSFRKSER
jgi:hypothetical protein